MANVVITVVNQSGQPMPGVLSQSGQYNTSPVPFGSSATSGPGSSFEGTTDQNGQLILSIPYTCPGEWTCNFYASGYDIYPFDEKTGYITGDVDYTVVMVATTGSPVNQPQGNPNEGNPSDANAAATESWNVKMKALTDWFSTYWWLLVLLVIGVIALILALRHKSGAKVIALPAGVKA